jgi:N-acetylglucosamine-6-phosphate deacetylase
MVGALFNHPTARCSVIPDGHHADYAAIKIAKKQMGTRLFVITDAVTETTEGFYRHRLEGDKYTSDGILSGSALTMHKAFQNLVRHVAVPVEEALRMCSLYPADLLGERKYGRISAGGAANLVVIGENLELLDVISA